MAAARAMFGAILVAFGTFVAYGFVSNGSGVAGFDPLSTNVPVVVKITTAGTMLLGIFANALWVAVGRTPEGSPIDIVGLITSVLRTPSFIKSALVSPIVFIVVYALVKNEPDPVVAHLLAFQNGFFWESVFADRKR